MADGWNVDEELKPLKVKCHHTKCKDNLHCFIPTRHSKPGSQLEHCQQCGVEAPFSWERLHQCDPDDIEYVIAALKNNEFIRNHYWTNEITEYAARYARRKGRNRMRDSLENHLRKNLGPPAKWNDTRQTPMDYSEKKQANAINYAQHATATCCRRCIKTWHGISKDRQLTDTEIAYFAELGMYYVNERFPQLTEIGEKVPRIRRSSKSNAKSQKQMELRL